MPFLANLIIYNAEDFDPEDLPGSPDAYEFDAMSFQAQPKQIQLEAIARPGHDDFSYRELGVRGEPSPIRTVLYLENRAAARQAMADYIDLKDGQPYEIYSNGQSWGFYNILGVAQVGEPIAVANAIGTLVTGPAVKHVVDFLVVNVTAPE